MPSRPHLDQHRDPLIIAIVIAWIFLCLVLDAGSALAAQRALGGVTWLLLFALISSESTLVKAQVAAVVAFATIIEYTGSPLLQLYIYRLDNVPAFVPPGHGLVYFAALTASRFQWMQRHTTILRWATLTVCGTWVAWGLFVSPRMDTLSALLFVVFAACMLRGRGVVVYTAAFVITTYLELLGTGLGNWTWQASDPAGWFGLGNPPAGIAGGYCVIDAVGLRVGPVLQGAGGIVHQQLREVRYRYSLRSASIGSVAAALSAGTAEAAAASIATPSGTSRNVVKSAG